MKELSIEEKAKRYDEALKAAKDVYTYYCDDREQLRKIESIFPELKESEDERVREGIKAALKFEFNDGCRIAPGYDVTREEALEWLEKQGEQKLTPIFRIGDTIIAKDGTYIEKEPFHIDKIEDDCYWNGENTILVCNQDEFEIFEQKPADKIKPKFKDGDWVTSDGESVFHITIDNNKYQLETLEGTSCHYSYEIIERRFRLWTIQDAKDGDVLACESGWTCIFKKLNHNSFGGLLFDSYCFIDRTGWFCDGAKGHTLDERINGKIYPATKEQRDLLFQKMKESGYEWDSEKKELKKIEQNPADEVGNYDHKEVLQTIINEQKPAEWNEEDIMRIDNIIAIIEGKGYPDYVRWLESLKDRVQPQPKQEWSEEDEKMFEECCIAIRSSEMHTLDEKEEMEIWLKSLRPQNKWKPSEEQIKVLQELCKYSEVANLTEKGVEILKSMYNDIKKLREE